MNGSYGQFGGRFGSMTCAPCYAGVFGAGDASNQQKDFLNSGATASAPTVSGGRKFDAEKFQQTAQTIFETAGGFLQMFGKGGGQPPATYDLPPPQPAKSNTGLYIVGGGIALLLAVGVGYSILKD